MPITEAFTFTAFLAIFFNVWFLIRAINRRIRLAESGQDGSLAIIANSFIKIWITILISDLLVFAAGAGIISGLRMFGYLLAIVPIASTVVGILAIRGLLRNYNPKEVK